MSRWGEKRRMREALLLIGGYGCENYTRNHCEANGRIEDADFTADAWCDACIANAALGRPRGRESYYVGPPHAPDRSAP